MQRFAATNEERLLASGLDHDALVRLAAAGMRVSVAVRTMGDAASTSMM